MHQVREIDYPFRSGGDVRPRWRRFALSLVWMAFPLAGLFSSHPSALRIAAVLAGFAAFIVCYGNALVGPWQQDDWHGRAAWIAAGAAVAAAMTLLDRSDWGILFIFLAITAGARLPEPLSFAALALAAGLAAGTILGRHGNAGAAISIAASSAGIGFLFILIRR